MRWIQKFTKCSWKAQVSAVSFLLSFSFLFSIAVKGTSGFLMKKSAVRRRSKAQIMDDKMQEESKLKDIEKKLQ